MLEWISSLYQLRHASFKKIRYHILVAGMGPWIHPSDRFKVKVMRHLLA